MIQNPARISERTQAENKIQEGKKINKNFETTQN